MERGFFFDSTRIGEVTLVDLSGPIREGEDISLLRNTVEDLGGKRRKKDPTENGRLSASPTAS